MMERWFVLSLGFFLGMGLLALNTAEASISLPKPSFGGKVSVEKAIKGRRTVRDFKEKGLSLMHLSQLLWAGQGITDSLEKKRAAPSAGALYPLDIYILIGESSVEKIEAGIYRYLPNEHSLLPIATGDRRRDMALASLSQMWMSRAPAMLIITSEYQRIKGKYGERGIRYALMEVGHVGQNLFLQAEALGLGTGIVGAFDDSQVSKIASLPTQHEPLLIIPVGYKK